MKKPGKGASSKYGIAFDVGTITIVGGLVDLKAKKELGNITRTNPQTAVGEDIISRVGHSIKHPEGLKKLNADVTSCLNSMIKDLLGERGISAGQVKNVICVGNVAIEHFLLGIHPQKLASAPYRSNLPRGTITTNADRMNLSALRPQTQVILPAAIKGFIGSDLTAGILFTRLHEKKGANFIIDLGANGEMALAVNGKVHVTSTAAGPAFEGGKISCGMRAQEGAITSVEIKNKPKIKVMGKGEPKGICGSGLVELTAQMLINGIIDKSGRMLQPYKVYDGKKTKIDIFPEDIRQIQLAKAAIRAGISALSNSAKVPLPQLRALYVAGAFGTFLDRDAALKIGLVPRIKKSRIKIAGNTAYKGALMMLLSPARLKEAQALAEAATHINLFARKDFQEEFVNRMGF